MKDDIMKEDIMNDPNKIINKDYTYAIIGASNNTEKYGHKVLNDLKNSGYKVIPINPKGEKILGLKTYKTLEEANEEQKNIDVVIFVVPPRITEDILNSVKKINIKKVWLQPGSESKEAIEFCKENNIECVHDMCIMIRRISN